jgi:hypothetical protein
MAMKNTRPAFELWEKPAENIPPGYQQTKCHLIFDVKMVENFRRKACFVAGGHTTKVPETLITCSSIRRWVLLTINLDGNPYHKMTSVQELV